MQYQSLRPLLDLPSVVENSLLQVLGYELNTAVVAYHVAEAFNDGVIRLINMSTAEFQCATVRFALTSAVHVDTWDGDNETAHKLCELGVRRNSFYEIQHSQWVDTLQTPHSSHSPLPALKHYALTFRTRIIQIAAASYRVSVERQSISAALQ